MSFESGTRNNNRKISNLAGFFITGFDRGDTLVIYKIINNLCLFDDSSLVLPNFTTDCTKFPKTAVKLKVKGLNEMGTTQIMFRILQNEFC